MAQFSVLVVTAAPPGQAAEAGGAFVKIDGRESLLRSVELFLNRDNVKQIQLCFLPDFLDEGKRKFGGHLSFSGVKVISGGPAWIDQLLAAAAKLSDDATHVIVHDAARPAVPYSDIEALMEEAEKHPFTVLAAASRQGLVEVDEGGNATAFHLAGHFMQLLTPIAYTKARFLEMAKTRQEPHASEATVVKASPLNVRISGSGDATLVNAMLRLLPKPKIKPSSSPFEEAQW
jgi:2-C-methyl-D-erythritol 4-phosphate cytidylyltransferase